jgi:hypothetical protein
MKVLWNYSMWFRLRDHVNVGIEATAYKLENNGAKHSSNGTN